jgi:hypothetical protein
MPIFNQYDPGTASTFQYDTSAQKAIDEAKKKQRTAKILNTGAGLLEIAGGATLMATGAGAAVGAPIIMAGLGQTTSGLSMGNGGYMPTIPERMTQNYYQERPTAYYNPYTAPYDPNEQFDWGKAGEPVAYVAPPAPVITYKDPRQQWADEVNERARLLREPQDLRDVEMTQPKEKSLEGFYWESPKTKNTSGRYRLGNGGMVNGGSHKSGHDLAIVDKNTGGDTGIRVEGGEMVFSKERTNALRNAYNQKDYNAVMQIVREQMHNGVNAHKLDEGTPEINLTPQGSSMNWNTGYPQDVNSINANYYNPAYFNARNMVADPNEQFNNKYNFTNWGAGVQPYTPVGVLPFTPPQTNNFNLQNESMGVVNPNNFNLTNASMGAIKDIYNKPNNFNLTNASTGAIKDTYNNLHNFNLTSASLGVLQPTIKLAETPNKYASEKDYGMMPISNPEMRLQQDYNAIGTGAETPPPTPSGSWTDYLKYAIPAIQTGLGAYASQTKLPEFTPPAEFNAMMALHKRQSGEGLSAQENMLLDRAIQDTYTTGLNKIYGSSGGNAGAILGNQNALAGDVLNAKIKQAALNADQRKKNQDTYAEDVAKQLALMQDAYKLKYAQAAGARAAGGNLMGVGLNNAQDMMMADALKKEKAGQSNTFENSLEEYFKNKNKK